jgi:serine/threonine-protein kinase
MPDEDDDLKPTAKEKRRREKLRVSAVTGVRPEPKAMKSADDPFIGQVVLDRYVVEALLGVGAMGAVYRGRHQKLDKTVAIKVLHPHFSDEPEMLARFRREARVAAKLQPHPNVIGVLDYGVAAGRQVMVLEFAKGPSLSEMIAIAPARRRIIQVVGQILRGLDHAHAAGLIHRDLKPDNIVVEIANDGTELPRIVDFGIAILRSPDNPEEAQRLTASGMMMGTPMYMAPEQAQCEPYDHRVDLFALGVIVYEMLAGDPPFDGSAMEIAVANISKDPPPIATRAPGRAVDPALELYARKLMKRKADDRFASAAEALEMLATVDRDPATASVLLGRTDVAKATATIALAMPRK